MSGSVVLIYWFYRSHDSNSLVPSTIEVFHLGSPLVIPPTRSRWVSGVPVWVFGWDSRWWTHKKNWVFLQWNEQKNPTKILDFGPVGRRYFMLEVYRPTRYDRCPYESPRLSSRIPQSMYSVYGGLLGSRWSWTRDDPPVTVTSGPTMMEKIQRRPLVPRTLVRRTKPTQLQTDWRWTSVSGGFY